MASQFVKITRLPANKQALSLHEMEKLIWDRFAAGDFFFLLTGLGKIDYGPFFVTD